MQAILHTTIFYHGLSRLTSSLQRAQHYSYGSRTSMWTKWLILPDFPLYHNIMQCCIGKTNLK